MNTHADKTQENKSQAVANSLSELQSKGASTFQFVDNRPEAVAQRELREAISNSPRVQQLKSYQDMANNSCHVSQLRAFQDVANNSLQAKQAAQLQAMANNHSAQQQQPIPKKENNTGLPDNLKSGIENLSGYSMNDVNVDYYSFRPIELQAHAYAQGTDIHLGPGQEKHLPDKAWHVIQQKQGGIKPNMHMKEEVNINGNAGLEKEAGVMDTQSIQRKIPEFRHVKTGVNSQSVIQRVWIGDHYPKKWDGLFDGVQWYVNEDGKIWYVADDLAPDHTFQEFAGIGNSRTYEAWDNLEIKVNIRTNAEERIRLFQNQKINSLDKKEAKEYEKNEHVNDINGEAPTPVLKNDADSPVSKTHWKWVEDDLGQIEKGGKGNTKFINMFHLPHEDAPVDAVVMMENFREKAAEFFASDVFFHQWMRVKKIKQLSDLPKEFPKYMYRNNISNKALASLLEKILGEQEYVDVDLESEDFSELSKTDNVKSTNNILREYNNINAIRNEGPSSVKAMRIFKGAGIRFRIEKE